MELGTTGRVDDNLEMANLATEGFIQKWVPARLGHWGWRWGLTGCTIGTFEGLVVKVVFC